MAMKVGELYQEMNLDTSGFISGIKSAKGMSAGLMKNLGKAGLIGTVTAAGAALAGLAREGAQNIQRLEDATQRYRSETGASEEAAKQFRDTVQSLHKQNTDSYEELGNAVTTLRQRHGDAAKGMEQDFLDYAKVTNQNTSQAIKDITEIQRAWGLEVQESSKLMDQLKAISADTGANIGNMQNALAEAQPAMKSMGMSVEEGAAMLGHFEDQGVNAQEAASGLARAVVRVEDPTKSQAEALRELGIEVEKTEDGFRTSDDAMQQVIDSLASAEKGSDNFASALEILGRRSGQNMYRGLQKGEQGMEDLMEVIENSKGTVKEASKQYDKQLGERWTLIKRKYLAPFMETLGTGLISLLESTLGLIEEWGPKVQKVFADITNFVGQMFGEGGAAEGFLKDLGITFGEIFQTIKEIITVFVGWAESFWEAFGDTIIAIGEYTWNGIKEVIGTVLDIIAGFVEAWKGVITGDWEAVGQALLGIWDTVWSSIKNIFSDYLNMLGTFLVDFVELFVDDWRSLAKSAIGIIDTFLQGAQDLFTSGLNTIASKVGKAISNIIGKFKWLHKIVPGLSKEMFDNAQESLKNLELVSEDLGQGIVDNVVGSMENMVAKTSAKTAEFKSNTETDAKKAQQAITREADKARRGASQAFTRKKNQVTADQKEEKANVEQTAKAESVNLKKIYQDLKNNTTGKVKDMRKRIESEYSNLSKSSKQELLTMVKEGNQTLSDGVDDQETTVDDGTDNMTQAYKDLKKDVTTLVDDITSGIESSFKDNFVALLKGTKGFGKAFSDFWGSIFDTILNKAASFLGNQVWDGIASIAGNLLGGGNQKSGGGGIISSVTSGIASVFGGGGSGGIMSAIGSALPWVSGAAAVGQGLSSIFGSGNLIKDIGGLLGFGGGKDRKPGDVEYGPAYEGKTPDEKQATESSIENLDTSIEDMSSIESEELGSISSSSSEQLDIVKTIRDHITDINTQVVNIGQTANQATEQLKAIRNTLGEQKIEEITFQIDGKTLARELEQPLADRISIKGGSVT